VEVSSGEFGGGGIFDEERFGEFHLVGDRTNKVVCERRDSVAIWRKSTNRAVAGSSFWSCNQSL
jgi:hypothetical protein